ncbi:MAG: hypothetical protein BGO21_18425 [Dyadobacter sp. 50-39]|uniref:type II toxin-antitoxin system PemK/MazF family toxin n=1 Tax=Dyadobacter sp. 50-39 TaxID=1895756 RepID=UPI0009645F43|nr:type II toxin-antitoxin system PemK/MazF family toxin [Dyadobacter sp. 50-39]OJV14679.1 MAG: hypothetical protein BGO21_18425 [Dyadobacter sp. 50-39]
MVKGDVILIPFPFTNLSGNKLRPAVVLAADNTDVTACFITSQIGWQEATDVLLNPSHANGLKVISLIRTRKIASIQRNFAKGLLGRLSANELSELNSKLKLLFQLP